jgi:ferric-dicitrate binding protein FerR (iron transport regulator)
MSYSEKRLWNLLALKLSGESTHEDLCELQNYLEQFPEFKNIADNIEVYWNEKNELEDINDEMEEERFHLILNAENDDELKQAGNNAAPVIKSTGKKYQFFFAAAAIIVLLVIGLPYLFNFKNTENIGSDFPGKKGIQQVLVKPGSKSKIVLPDGTVVRLNGSSKLSYHKDFNKKFREVYLDGEAYFDVTKNAKHPFIVHTSSIDIRVLGTSFNVKSYDQDSTIETTLLRGSIEVFNKNDESAPKVILKPNEKLVFRKIDDEINQANKKMIAESSTIIPDGNISICTLPANKPDSLKEETSWLYNKLLIDNDDFLKMAQKMERWYGVKIKILSPQLEKYHFKGIFDNETVEEALHALQLTVKFRYKINDDVITITQ